MHADSFLAGVRERCDGLSPDSVARVVDHILASKSADANLDAIKARLGGWADKAYGAALKVPTPVLLGGAAAAASLPLTAMFGRRGEDGKKHYGRNALFAGSAAVAAPFVYTPKWLANHNQNKMYGEQMVAYDQEKRPVLDEMTRVAQEPYGKDKQEGIMRQLRAAAIQRSIMDPYLDLAKTYGDPAKRWRHLAGPMQWPARDAYLKLPTYRRMEEIAGPISTANVGSGPLTRDGTGPTVQALLAGNGAPTAPVEAPVWYQHLQQQAQQRNERDLAQWQERRARQPVPR